MFWNQFCDFIDMDPDLDQDWSNVVDSDPDTINPDPALLRIQGLQRTSDTKSMTLKKKAYEII